MNERRMTGVEAWINRYHLVSTVVMVSALALNAWAMHWSYGYAMQSKLDGVGTGLVIAAVQANAGFYLKWALEMYFKLRELESNERISK
jgi:hypothetical protein